MYEERLDLIPTRAGHARVNYQILDNKIWIHHRRGITISQNVNVL